MSAKQTADSRKIGEEALAGAGDAERLEAMCQATCALIESAAPDQPDALVYQGHIACLLDVTAGLASSIRNRLEAIEARTRGFRNQ